MEPITRIESATLPVTKIAVKDGEKTTEYQLVLDYNALIKAEEQIGKDLSVRRNWIDLSKKDLTALAWAGLDRFHPEVTLKQFRQMLSPTKQAQLWVMLIEQAQPGILQEIEDTLKEQERKEAIAKAAGKDSIPNPQEAVVAQS